MANFVKLIEQDITVAESYLDKKKFDFINIVGNRILQNMYVTNKKELMISGLVIKEISSDLNQVNTNKIKDVVILAKKCLEDIKSNLSGGTPQKIWDVYYDFEDKIRKFILPSEESIVYKDDFEFTTEVTINYLNILISNKDVLLKRNIRPLEITRIELGSLFNKHGGKNAIVSYLITRAFEYVYRFALNGKISDDELAVLSNENIDKINEVKNIIQSKEEGRLIDLANNMIGDLMYDFRKYFMLFGEIKLEEEIPLPADISQKIQKIIEKHKAK